jgi:hypothetical protein
MPLPLKHAGLLLRLRRLLSWLAPPLLRLLLRPFVLGLLGVWIPPHLLLAPTSRRALVRAVLQLVLHPLTPLPRRVLACEVLHLIRHLLP